MKSKVYFCNMRATKASQSISSKVSKLFDIAGFKNIISENDLTAIKVHFGEKGNNAYISPIYVRQIVDKVKSSGGKPFLTDSNTLYKGSRSNGVDHLITAIENGFAYSVVNAPIVIADGIYSKDSLDVAIHKKHFDSVKISSNVVRADSMIVLSHFKGHEIAGFGGAIKNLAMGGAPAAGKQQQHSTVQPKVEADCRACKMCLKNCPEEAITMVDGAAYIDPDKCIGCGECISVCTFDVIKPQWGTEMDKFIERMTEYAYGAYITKKEKIAFMNFVINVTPLCDCVPWSDAPIVPDIGVLASFDPVAIDQASFDLVNSQTGHLSSFLGDKGHGINPGEDKFKAIHPKTRGELQLEYGEELGLGTRDYELIEVK
ncbi:DUF362 domain-containing protein [Zhaonella formicivorans]|uniref:DUF362 domain-containing protein n=1 Tax=Zhaonella formicivorans TaxID=2528593 RepID=UPI0010DD0BC3|nr:DUF362 domain-containing protein [Zhaonella formicivorans]